MSKGVESGAASRDIEAVGRALAKLAIDVSGRSPSESWTELHVFVRDLVSDGWRRGDVHRLVVHVLNDHAADLPDDAQERLLDYEGALIGHCHKDSIPRFPGEPQVEDEFLEYVRGKAWKDD